VRSNTFVNNLWQYREFKADINAKGENIFVVDSVKSNSLDDLFADEGSLDSDSLKASKVDFLRDYNELQSDSNTINDNNANANAKNKNLKTIIGKKPSELDSSGYSAKMIVNTHQNYYEHQKYPPQQSATFPLFFASNLSIKLPNQINIAQSIPRTEWRGVPQVLEL
jgi:hypothetical protein